MDRDSTPVTQTQKVNTAPWADQQPYLRRGFEEAESFLNSQNPQYFPESTVVGFSPESEQALDLQRARALEGSNLLTQAQDQQLAQSRGDYLAGSPFFEQAVEQRVAPMMERYALQDMPGLNSAFAAHGRLGSNAHQQASQTQNLNFQRALGETIGGLAHQNYLQERGLQNQASRALPDLAQADYMDIGRLGQVGQAREGQLQAELQDDVNRWNFDQNRDANRIAQYMGLVGGGYGTQGNTSTISPMQGRDWFSTLGGLASLGIGAKAAGIF